MYRFLEEKINSRSDSCRCCALRRMVLVTFPQMISFVKKQRLEEHKATTGLTKLSHVRDTIESNLTRIGHHYCSLHHALNEYPWTKNQSVTLRRSDKCCSTVEQREGNGEIDRYESTTTEMVLKVLLNIFWTQTTHPYHRDISVSGAGAKDDNVPMFTILPIFQNFEEIIYWLIRIMPLMCDSFVLTVEVSPSSSLTTKVGAVLQHHCCCKYSVIRDQLEYSLPRMILNLNDSGEELPHLLEIESYIARLLVNVSKTVCETHQMSIRRRQVDNLVLHMDCTLFYDKLSSCEGPFVERSTTTYHVLRILRDILTSSSGGEIPHSGLCSHVENWENVLYWLSRLLSLFCDTFSFHIRHIVANN